MPVKKNSITKINHYLYYYCSMLYAISSFSQHAIHKVKGMKIIPYTLVLVYRVTQSNMEFQDSVKQ